MSEINELTASLLGGFLLSVASRVSPDLPITGDLALAGPVVLEGLDALLERLRSDAVSSRAHAVALRVENAEAARVYEQAIGIADRRAVNQSRVIALLVDALMLASQAHADGCHFLANTSVPCSCGVSAALNAYKLLLADLSTGYVRNCGTCRFWRRVEYARASDLVLSSEVGQVGLCSSPHSPIRLPGDGRPLATSWSCSCSAWGMVESE